MNKELKYYCACMNPQRVTEVLAELVLIFEDTGLVYSQEYDPPSGVGKFAVLNVADDWIITYLYPGVRGDDLWRQYQTPDEVIRQAKEYAEEFKREKEKTAMLNRANYKKIELTNVQVAMDENGRRGLHIVYECTKANGDIDRVNIPNVALDIPAHDFPSYKIEHNPCSYSMRTMVDIGNGWQEALEGPVVTKEGVVNAIVVTETIRKAPCKKMTLAEVEEKLGYRVELISEEE